MDFYLPSPRYSGERLGVRGEGFCERQSDPLLRYAIFPAHLELTVSGKSCPSPPAPLPRLLGRGEIIHSWGSVWTVNLAIVKFKRSHRIQLLRLSSSDFGVMMKIFVTATEGLWLLSELVELRQLAA